MAFKLPAHLFCEPPVTVYLRCKNARSRPKDLKGEWITAGRLYTGRYLAGRLLVKLDGRHAEPPYRLLQAWRFCEIAELWLN